MKFVRRVSLFLISSVFLMGAGGYAALRAEQFFYPNRYQEPEGKKIIWQKNDEINNDISNDIENEMAGEAKMQEQIIETAVEKVPVVTADTTYLIEEINLADGSIREKQEEVPVKYIGLDRESLIKELESYDRNPPLSEQEMGFETIELTEVGGQAA